ncbi:unnamed protein product [Brugia pahangi]|uniref:WD_REPEATS_REGION domain-containing protein n=1 Tax=Brugia pahangi TaxID=6280 RepID=A0A0N4U071_BRUPA|nr:unnamed protein product [Brugia pahangi]
MDRRMQTKILTHNCPPYALVYTNNAIIIGGCDQRIVSYTENGQLLQQFDYCNEIDHEKEFTVAVRDTFGQSVIFGSFDRNCLHLRPDHRSFISGHTDGSIILYSMDRRMQTKILTHNCPPYALVYTNNAIIIGGCDQRIVSYTENGQLLQQFDYCNEIDHEKEFTVAVRDTFGQSVIFGSFDRVRLYSWNSRRGALDEGKPLEIRYLYTISALAWSPDGSTIAVGTLCGAVIILDCCLKHFILKGHFETKYVSPSQVIIKDTSTEQHVTIHSSKGLPINEIKVIFFSFCIFFFYFLN